MAPRTKKPVKKSAKTPSASRPAKPRKAPPRPAPAAKAVAATRTAVMPYRMRTLLEMPQTGALLGGAAGVLFFVGFLLVIQALIPSQRDGDYFAAKPAPGSTIESPGGGAVPAAPGPSAPSAMAAGAPFIQSLLAPTTIGGGAQGGLAQSKQVLVRNGQEWDALWAQIPQAPRPTVRAIDFNRYSVAAVFAGEQSAGGVSVEITHAVQADGQTRITAIVLAPGQRCAPVSGKTSPFTLALFPKIDGPVQFTVENLKRDC